MAYPQLKKLKYFMTSIISTIFTRSGSTDDLIERCRRANFDGLCLTVDTLAAGNRERDHRTGFTTPPVNLKVY